MTWTLIPKPSVASWTGVNKPSESSIAVFTNEAEPWGMLIAITKPTFGASILTGWTDIPKPTSPNWTSVPKPLT